MLHVFTGSNVPLVRKAAHDFLKGGGEMHDVCTPETYVQGIFLMYAQEHSLFGDAPPVLFDGLLAHKDIHEEFVLYIEALVSSLRLCVLLEPTLSPTLRATLKESGAAFTDFTEEKAQSYFNTFLLGDALARKDKKSLWLLLMRAYRAGVSGEEILGTLFWQIKTMRIARISKNAEEANLKPFVYTKAKAAGKYYNEDELAAISRTLVCMFHEGHRGEDMTLALERFVLSL